MSEVKKFEDLTKEQQTAVKVAGRKFIIGMFLNGVNAGGLIVMSNLILVLLNLTYFNSTPFLLVSCVIADIYFFNMMGKLNADKTQKFKDTIKQVIDAK